MLYSITRNYLPGHQNLVSVNRDSLFEAAITLDCIYASMALAAVGESWVRRADVNVGSVNSTEKPGSPGNRLRLLNDLPPYQWSHVQSEERSSTLRLAELPMRLGRRGCWPRSTRAF
ncbi:hypothetical protein CDEST_12924 [Colletotrichum destructivum]|uniref:Uncharacterized protein n=1 Tax=Colletotrichum destructivum TaxID=34406 RepID=A0AAX4IXC4_9PEZI|nr:hypothetical protein CDEST_12924 [Colletotrichum destructivum]